MNTRRTSFRTILTMSVLLLVGCSSSGDGGGNTPDNTSPVITLTGDNPQVIAVGEAYVELGATASDNRDGNLTTSITIDASAIDSSTPGTYQVTYDVSDAAGNAATTVTRMVIYEDRVPPVISPVGDDPLVLPMGSDYTDPGATASDNVDGDISASITTDTSAVDTSTPGNYLVTYNVTDAAGNAATEVTRAVTVELTAPAEATVSVTGDIKTLNFSWSEPDYVDYYRLLENADGHSGFSQVGDDIPAGTLTAKRDIAAHLFDWVDAQYIVEACNVMGCSYSDVVTATDVMLDTIGYFKASNTDQGDRFGTSIAISGDGTVMVVGAPEEDSEAAGVDGDQAGNLLENSGAVYVFSKEGSGWVQQAYIKASNPGVEDRFGSTVEISSDGTTLAVGAPGEDSNAVGVNGEPENNLAPDAGAVYVFRFDNQQWTQQAYVKPSVPTGYGGRGGVPTEYAARYGPSVALNANGSRLAIGLPYEDNCAGGINDLTYSDEVFCEDSGAVYIFAFDGQDWSQQTYFGGFENSFWSLGTRFGYSVDLSADGNRLAASAPKYERSYPGQFGAVFVYTNEGNNWTRQLVGPAEFDDDFTSAGDAIDLSADGNRLTLNVSWENIPDSSGPVSVSSAVLIYDFVDSIWEEKRWISSPNGVSTLALSGDGQILAVGATSEASMAVGVNGDENDDSAARSGAAYLFALENESWVQTTYVKASNTHPLDLFGRGLALSFDGTTLAIGAVGEDSQAVEINGDDADNTAEAAGAVYVH